MEGIRAEGSGGRFQFRIEAGEGVPDHTDDYGRVVKDVSKEDRSKSSNKLERRKRKKVVNESACTEEGVERRSNNHGRQHKWDSGHCAQKGFAAEIIAREEISRGEPEKEREEGGEDSLIKRKSQCMISDVQIFISDRFEIEGEGKNAGKRKEESNDKK